MSGAQTEAELDSIVARLLSGHEAFEENDSGQIRISQDEEGRFVVSVCDWAASAAEGASLVGESLLPLLREFREVQRAKLAVKAFEHEEAAKLYRERGR